MKYLTITVPCYNSGQYLERCLDSLITKDDRVEIIVVDDGSTDRTGEIADGYAEKFPEIVRVVHKENGGHGSGVNTGLRLASGRYFKVVDSDDWLDAQAYAALLAQIGMWEAQKQSGQKDCFPDLLICDYTYNHLYNGKKTMGYQNVFPKGQVCTWEEIGRFRPSQYLIMHALIYRTEVLRKSGVILPEHTYYVDNIFANYPLTYVETLCYLDLDLYQYYLGREDQSVNERVLIRRIEEQIKVTKIVAACIDFQKVKQQHPKLAAYLYRNVSIMMAISSIHLLLAGDELANKRYKELWSDLKMENPGLYYRLKYTTISGLTNLPGKAGKRLSVTGYRIAKKIYKFQ